MNNANNTPVQKTLSKEHSEAVQQSILSLPKYANLNEDLFLGANLFSAGYDKAVQEIGDAPVRPTEITMEEKLDLNAKFSAIYEKLEKEDLESADPDSGLELPIFTMAEMLSSIDKFMIFIKRAEKQKDSDDRLRYNLASELIEFAKSYTSALKRQLTARMDEESK